MKMEKDKDDEIKFIIDNPECIPIAKKRLVKFLYDAYVRETDLHKVEKLKKAE